MIKKLHYKDPATLRRHIGAVMRLIRKESGLQQIDLAETAGVKRQYISELENGKVNATIDTLLSICMTLNVSLSDVIARAETL